MKKTLVNVEWIALKGGFIRPTKIHWEDGRSWKISQVLHMSTFADEDFEGIRYTLLIDGAEKYLYRDGTKWYVVPV